jgi:hypothetical protein
MDFFEFWFWHRWFHRDDPNYDDSNVFGGFMKFMLILVVLIFLAMLARTCQNGSSSDQEFTSKPAEVKKETVNRNQHINTPDTKQTTGKQAQVQQTAASAANQL